ncbi:MAG: hypothetical protein HYW48_01055 [Deltaproteobacteria bacterium]|nr:hypothetical protein [Deltaproteobacteria bacterium]
MHRLPSSETLTSYLHYYFDGEAFDVSEKGSLSGRWFRIHNVQAKILTLPEAEFEPTLKAIEALVDKAHAKPQKDEKAANKKKTLGIALYEQVSESRANVSTDKRVGTIHG